MVAWSKDLQLGEDPKGLRVTFEAIGQSEALPRQSVEDPLTKVAERWMAKIMRSRGCLYHDMIKTSKIMK